MLKLIKYEFRKNRTGLLVMLAIALALFLMAFAGRATDNDGMIAASVVLLLFYCVAAYIFVLVRGILAYSSELRSKTGYLLLMTPRSTYSILFSKLLFTLFFALLLLVVSALMTVAVAGMLMAEVYEVKSVVELFRMALAEVGLSLSEVTDVLLIEGASLLCGVLNLVAVAYLSVTLSATVQLRGFLKGLTSFALFVALALIGSKIRGLVGAEFIDFASAAELLRMQLPAFGIDLLLTALYTALSAVLLKRKVCL